MTAVLAGVRAELYDDGKLTMNALQPGTRMKSQACATEVIVVRTGAGGVELNCGGHPMLTLAESAPAIVDGAPELMTGSALGKRYSAETDASFEVLVTKAGTGTLSDGPTPLVIKQAKPLPASD
jgi:hypothetical protein